MKKKQLACTNQHLILNATTDTEKGCLVNIDRCTEAIYKRDVTYLLANHVTIVNKSCQKQRTAPILFSVYKNRKCYANCISNHMSNNNDEKVR